jgi:hypothetical protein
VCVHYIAFGKILSAEVINVNEELLKRSELNLGCVLFWNLSRSEGNALDEFASQQGGSFSFDISDVKERRSRRYGYAARCEAVAMPRRQRAF